MKISWISLILISFFLLAPGIALAQDEQHSGPTYIVQAGDTLWDIAARFGISVEELKAANGGSDAIQPGDRLVIPGLEGIQGILNTQVVPFGETLRSLSRRYQIPGEQLAQINRITTPVELYAGANLIIPQQENALLPGKRVALNPGQSLFELAILQDSLSWEFVRYNGLSSIWTALPGDVLRIPGNEEDGPGALPAVIRSVEINPLPLVQGKTTVLRVIGEPGMSLGGSLTERDLHFFSAQDGIYDALQGVHALLAPGLYPLTIKGTLASGAPFGMTQMIRVAAGDYLIDPPIYVDPATIDPEITRPEDAQWNALAAPFSPQKLWEGIFSIPVDPIFADCWPSQFGSRRSYNDSEYIYFHTGLDFCGSTGNPIYAPASGIVVFAGPLTVRGNATMIDHGWGIYSAYMHQSEILVNEGERVETGQLIGRVGSTGRVTGPHLHFEVWVGGIQVDPLDWLRQIYP
jgi:murein DD-endopeptidase MepM/ murein hydrolase activator NlpD